MEQGYLLHFDGTTYEGFKDGRKFTLGTAREAMYGVAGFSIESPFRGAILRRGMGSLEFKLPNGTWVDRYGLTNYLRSVRGNAWWWDFGYKPFSA